GCRSDSQGIKRRDREQTCHLRFRAVDGRRDRDQVFAVRRQRDRACVNGAAPAAANDKARMSNVEITQNNQMTKHSRCLLSDFVLRHSIVIRYSCFVIFLALGIGTVLAEKRPITEKDLWDFVWIGDPQVSPDGSHIAFVRVTVNEKKE